MRQFSIITPTYNRANLLLNAYNSLCRQDGIDFEWIIIDDGSTDNTREVIEHFYGKFKIKFIYQENTGKPSAMNKGVQNAESFISLSLDSDDILCPDALNIVWEYFNVNTGMFFHDCVCVSGLCQYADGSIIGDKFPYDNYVSDHINCRFNNNIKGDKSEFYLTTILKKYPFPIINNEKFIAESIVWNRIAIKYNTLYVNKVFKQKVFLKNGLSNQPIWKSNPYSSEYYFNESTNPKFKLSIRIKNLAKYIYYARKNNKSLYEIYLSCISKNIFIFGLITNIFYNIKVKLKYFTKTSKIIFLLNKRKNWKKYIT